MIALVLLALVLALVWQARSDVERANDEVRDEVGERYNAEAAGQPRDGCVLSLLVVAGTFIVLMLIGSQVPLP